MQQWWQEKLSFQECLADRVFALAIIGINRLQRFLKGYPEDILPPLLSYLHIDEVSSSGVRRHDRKICDKVLIQRVAHHRQCGDRLPEAELAERTQARI